MFNAHDVACVVRDEHLSAQLRRAEELQARFYVQSEQFRHWQRSYHQHMQMYYARKVDYHERMTYLYKNQLLDSASPRGVMAPSMALHPTRPHVDDSFMTMVSDAVDITDEQWAQVAALLPLGSGRGRPYINDRRTLNGVLYITTHHIGWSHMPARYGSYVTCWRRYLRWQSKGIWQQVLRLLHLESTDVFPGNSQGTHNVAVPVADMPVADMPTPEMYTAS